MGTTPSKQASQQTTGTVINEVEIHQAEIVNSDIRIVLYLIVIILVIQMVMTIYKMWCKNLKRKYLARAPSRELL